MSDTKKVYKQVMDTLQAIRTKVLSMKICRLLNSRARHVEKSLLQRSIHTAIPMCKEGTSILSTESIKSSFQKNTLKVKSLKLIKHKPFMHDII